jgi:hypothetical protein
MFQTITPPRQVMALKVVHHLQSPTIAYNSNLRLYWSSDAPHLFTGDCFSMALSVIRYMASRAENPGRNEIQLFSTIAIRTLRGYLGGPSVTVWKLARKVSSYFWQE